MDASDGFWKQKDLVKRWKMNLGGWTTATADGQVAAVLGGQVTATSPTLQSWTLISFI